MRINLRRNSPLILSIAGLAGLVTTVIFAFKEAPKAVEALKEQEEESVYEPTVVEKAMVVAPICWKTIAAGTATAFCILFSNYISRKQQAALFGAAMLSNQMLEKFKRHMTKEQIREVEADIAVEEYENAKACGGIPFSQHYNPNDLSMLEDRLFYDAYTGEWFYSTELSVKERLYEFQRSFAIDSKIGINDYTDALGITTNESRKKFELYGFNSWMFLDDGRMPWIDILLKDDVIDDCETGGPIHYTVIYFDEEPLFDYLRYGK